jgi:NAD+ synthase
VSLDALRLTDPSATIVAIAEGLRGAVGGFRRRGAVVGLSGGIDSSVVAALAARAFGPKRVLGVLMPEADSSDDSLALGHLVADAFQIPTVVEDITELLVAAGCYRRRDEAIRQVIPEYGPGWKSKIVLPNVAESDQYRLYALVARSPEGREVRVRLPLDAYLGVVAATSFKQRARKMIEYYHADRLHYAVLGTPNRLEYDQGFFVKNGDGAADVKPIAHLYKTQVYQLAEALGVPAEVRSRPPTTDTYSLPQTQEEFYFSLPYDQMDACLHAVDRGRSAADVAADLGLAEEQVERVFADIAGKRRMAHYLHAAPVVWSGDGPGAP